MREVGGGHDHGRRSQKLSDEYRHDTCRKPAFTMRTAQKQTHITYRLRIHMGTASAKVESTIPRGTRLMRGC